MIYDVIYGSDVEDLCTEGVRDEGKRVLVVCREHAEYVCHDGLVQAFETS